MHLKKIITKKRKRQERTRENKQKMIPRAEKKTTAKVKETQSIIEVHQYTINYAK